MNFTPRAATAVSVASNTLLVGTKVAVGLLTGSVSIMSEALHSGMDLLAAIIAFFSVSVAARPPDEDHQYGHGKVENVSGVIEAALILAAAVLIVVEAVKKLLHGGEVEKLGWGLGVMGLSVVVNIVVSRILFATAKRHDSIAVEADAHHLSTDVFTSLGVFGGLLLVKLTGLHILDAIVAIAVAVFIAWLGVGVLRKAFVDLIDISLPPEIEARIRKVIEEHLGMFVEYHKMRTRKSGPEKYIDLHLVFCRYETIQSAHKISHHVENDLKSDISRLQVTVHLEPCGRNREMCEMCEIGRAMSKNNMGN